MMMIKIFSIVNYEIASVKMGTWLYFIIYVKMLKTIWDGPGRLFHPFVTLNWNTNLLKADVKLKNVFFPWESLTPAMVSCVSS